MIPSADFEKADSLRSAPRKAKNHTPLRSRRDQRKQNVGHLFAFRSCRIGNSGTD